MVSMKKIPVKDFYIGPDEPLAIMSGPCVIESEEHALKAAEQLCLIFRDYLKGINLIYKSSYDKANRSANASFRGPGLEKGLQILAKVKKEFNLPVLTDVHTPEEALAAGQVCDIIQIPAFLCRQTDLVLAAGKAARSSMPKKVSSWPLGTWEMSSRSSSPPKMTRSF